MTKSIEIEAQNASLMPMESRLLGPAGESLVREVNRRLDHLTGQGTKIEVDQTEKLTPGERFRDYESLRRAVQLAALREWNGPGDPPRPEWTLFALLHYSPAPLNVDNLTYLSSQHRESVRARAEKDQRYVALERKAITLMRKLLDWSKEAKRTLACRHPDDGIVGPGMLAIHRMLDPDRDLESICEAFAGSGGVLARQDRVRTNLVHEIPRMLRREATTREIALASLLFGWFPKETDDSAWIAAGRTVAEAIEAETRLIDKARGRRTR